jgi:transposase
MDKRFHGIDRHKRSSTICMLNREGIEEKLITYGNFSEYVKTLGEEDVVVMETGLGCFHWANKIEKQGAAVYVIDPYRFRIIKDSWKKTDKNDCRNLAKALWVFKITGEFGIPEVYKPSCEIIELRRLFSQYCNMNKYLNMLKNNVQSILLDNGIVLTAKDLKLLFAKQTSDDLLTSIDASDAGKVCIRSSIVIYWNVLEQKKLLTDEIIKAGKPFQDKVKLLISIKGITPLTALAFLADVADVTRFKKVRNMNAYLGLVPKIKSSGNRSSSGHINRASRKLTRTILTQSLIHAMDASPRFRSFYDSTKYRRGVGRARIALIRKICSVMRRMLLNNELYNNIQEDLYNKKLHQFETKLNKLDQEKKRA